MRSHVFLATLGFASSAILVGQLAANSQPPTFGPSIANDEMESTMGVDIYDVTPCRIGSLTQFGRMGSFPTGTVAMGLSTTGQNVGNIKLPWYVSPDVHHPVIGQNMYRINTDGRLEMIGMSWLKHGWFAVQGSSCGSCTPHNNGRELGIGCADTYGASLNAEQAWLGPRWEVNPNAQIWMNGDSWVGSHFQRNGGNNDTGGHNQVEHRLRVQMGDLTQSGATYYYEGTYWLNTDLGSNDQRWLNLDELAENMFNNARHFKVNPNHDGNGNFTYSNVGNSINGPIAAQWGDMQSMANTGLSPDDDGVLWISSRSVDLGGGQHRYEYVVYNMSVDREIASLAIPTGGANITDIGFHSPKDGYYDAGGNFVNESPYGAQDWNATVDGGVINFEPPAGGGELDPNTIRFGTLYTFWFTADRGPAVEARAAEMSPFRVGDISKYTGDVVAPDSQVTRAQLDTLDVVVGILQVGDVTDLFESDNSIIQTLSGFGQAFTDLHNMTMIVGATTNAVTPIGIDLTLESRISEVAGIVHVKLMNWNTNQYDRVGGYAIGNSWQVDSIDGIDATNYVGNNGEIEVSVQHVVFVPFLAFTFRSFFDQLLIEITE